jgi:hypothetical protein
VEVVEQLRTEIFEALGGIGKGLFESIAAEENVADNLAFVGFKRGFGLRIEGGGYGRRIGAAFCDGVAEELEDIVVLPSLDPGQAVPALDVGGCAVLCLTVRIQLNAAAAEHCQEPYQNIPHQAFMNQTVLL